MGIFGAEIDVAVSGAYGDAGDGHALDEHEGIALHDHPVGEGAGIAFVGVAHDVFLLGWRLRHGAPFDAGRKSGAAAPAQAGIGDLLDNGFGADLERLLQALVTAMRAVIVERARIVVHDAEKQVVLVSLVEQRWDIPLFDRPIADASLGRIDLDQRLEPVHAARLGAHDFEIEVPALGFLAEGGGDLVGADAQCA